MAAVVCQACGAKINAARACCPRCGEVFAAVPLAADAPKALTVLGRYRGPSALAGSVLSVALLVAVIASRPDPVEEQVVRTSPLGRPAAPATAAPAPPDPGVLDSKNGGKASYAAGDYVSSLEHYKGAVARNPNDGDALNNLGQLLSRNGDPAAAIPHLEKASRLYPNVWAYRFNLAHAHGRLGNWSQAVDDYRLARNLFPDDYVTHFNLGTALHKLRDDEAAVYEFRKGAELAPSEPSFHLSLGISYEQMNLIDQAVKSYEQYLALAPSTPDADKVKARIELLRKPA